MGGRARAEALSAEERSAVAAIGGMARWHGSKVRGDYWEYFSEEGSVRVETPKGMSKETWEKLEAFVKLLKPNA
jgi:hypothetical protein